MRLALILCFSILTTFQANAGGLFFGRDGLIAAIFFDLGMISNPYAVDFGVGNANHWISPEHTDTNTLLISQSQSLNIGELIQVIQEFDSNVSVDILDQNRTKLSQTPNELARMSQENCRVLSSQEKSRPISADFLLHFSLKNTKRESLVACGLHPEA